MNVAFEIGVKGFICKTSGIGEIKKALLNILQGKVYLPDVSADKTNIGLAKITQRQKEVLILDAPVFKPAKMR
jgi:DNA-binding NarL/FixJ family response regulator